MNQEEKEAALVAVFKHYGLPEPRHGEQRFKCPIHGDKSASASVNRGRGLWNCHGCGLGGDAITLIMEVDGLSQREAWQALEDIMGGSGWSATAKPKKASRRWVPPALRGTA